MGFELKIIWTFMGNNIALIIIGIVSLVSLGL